MNIIAIMSVTWYFFFFFFFLAFATKTKLRPFVAFHLDRYQVHYSINSPGKARRSTSFKRRGCPAAEAGFRSRRRTTHVGCAHDRGMANKENELTCSEEVRGNCGLPVNSAEASKMAEASSKYSDFTEVRVALKLLCVWLCEKPSLFLGLNLNCCVTQGVFPLCHFGSYQRTTKLWLMSFSEEIYD